jgi:hypothetical protein
MHTNEVASVPLGTFFNLTQANHWKIERLGSYKNALQFVVDNTQYRRGKKSTRYFEGPNPFRN